MKKLIIIALLTAGNVLGGTIQDNLDKLSHSPDIIVFINGHRLHPLTNDGGDQHNFLKASNEETWEGFDVNDIPRFVGVHVKQSSPSNQHQTFYNLIETIPDSHGGFLKLNCLLELTRKNPRLTKLIFRWVLENEKRFGIVVGHEIMAANPEEYMAYRAIVDDVAPEMANTFELGYVWLNPRTVGPGAPLLERFATE